MDTHTACEQVIAFFETIDPDSVARIPQLYAHDARFKDPFNDVTGVASVMRIFEKMFDQVHNPRFVIDNRVIEGQQAFIHWRFEFKIRKPLLGQRRAIEGVTHFQFNPQGQITLHRDYWDAAEELYETLPLLGGLMRCLKRQIHA